MSDEQLQLALLEAEIEQAACEVSALAKSVRELERVIDRRLAKRKARANNALAQADAACGGSPGATG
jgi:hypothetical protein